MQGSLRTLTMNHRKDRHKFQENEVIDSSLTQHSFETLCFSAQQPTLAAAAAGYTCVWYELS